VPGSILLTEDGGFIICGESCSNDIEQTKNKGNRDYYIIKTDSAGNIEWQSLIGGPGEDGSYDIKETSDGYVVIGVISAAGGDVNTFYDKHDSWLVKLNKKGTILWQRTFGRWDWDQMSSITETFDRGFVIAGWTEGPKAWVIRTDSLGKIIWERTYGGICQASSIRQTKDGGFAVAGYSWGNPTPLGGGKMDYLILKLDADGNALWSRRSGSPSCDNILSMDLTDDGGYVLAGYLSVPDPDPSDCWVIKFDSVGNEQWNRTYGGSQRDWVHCIKQTSDKGFIFAGQSNSTDGDRKNPKGDIDYWVVKLNSLGAIEWEESFGGSQSDVANSIIEISPGEYVIAGESYSSDGDVKSQRKSSDIWVVKIGQKPKAIKQHEANAGLAQSFKTNPNPANGTLFFEYISQSETGSLEIKIVNTIGETVFHESMDLLKGLVKKEIDISTIKAGTYSIVLLSQNGTETKKIVIQ
jgi:hypothetical protein